MAENIAQTVQKVIQDLVAPDVRELKTVVTNLQSELTHVESSLQKQIDQRFEAQDKKAEAQNQKADAQFRALMSALGEFKAQSDPLPRYLHLQAAGLERGY